MKGRFFLLLTSTVLVAALLGPRGSVRADVVHRHYRPVCGIPAQRFAQCNSYVVTDAAGKPLTATSPAALAGAPYAPAQLHTAYNLPCTPNGAVSSTCTAPSSYSTQPIIAIVDAYDDPNIVSNLATYDSQWGLPACKASPSGSPLSNCLTVVNQSGGSTLPGVDTSGGWELEEALDVETANQICQTCRILLVEANSSSLNDLATAVNRAASMGAKAISNSYGGGEGSYESSFDASYYDHPGIAVVASSGDSGNSTGYPATSPDVVAVGGTSLLVNSDNTYNSETAWNSGGSGCSAFESAASAQQAVSNWGQTGCGTSRGVADVSADADPSTGVSVYDTYPYNGTAGQWWQVGGTSLSSPLVAGAFVLANPKGLPSGTEAPSVLYQDFNTSNSHDVTSGTNGTCGTIMCQAVAGYDGPTGLGSPNGLAGFGGAAPIATATATATSGGPAPTATNTVAPTTTSTPRPTSTARPTATSTKVATGPTATATVACRPGSGHCKK